MPLSLFSPLHVFFFKVSGAGSYLCASSSIPGLFMSLRGFQLAVVLFSCWVVFYHHETLAVRFSHHLVSD